MAVAFVVSDYENRREERRATINVEFDVLKDLAKGILDPDLSKAAAEVVKRKKAGGEPVVYEYEEEELVEA